MRTPWFSWMLLSSLMWGMTGAQAQAQPLPPVPTPSTQRAIPSTSVVSQERARQYASPVWLYLGRNSVIDFSGTDEVITYVQLSDVSQMVYDTNAPIDSGAARTIILRLIQPLHVDGIYTAAVPNLVVTTVDLNGNTYTYLFDLYHSPDLLPDADDASGIAIMPAPDVRDIQLSHQNPTQPNIIRTDAGNATLNHLERGLSVAIEADYTPPDDPIVFAVREAIAMARNGTPIRTAAQQLQIDLAVLTSLGELGINANDETDDDFPLPEPLEIQTEVEELI